MNANELADELEDALDTDSWCQECALETTEPVARQAATMLRQQQSEIEALKQSKSEASNKANLTDEEITDVYVECMLPYGEFDEHEFARAILRKAQEK
jgi:hypothetical protein